MVMVWTMTTNNITLADGKSRDYNMLATQLSEHEDLVAKAVVGALHSNPLHGDTFKSTATCESEVVAMTASLFGGGRGSSVCGNVTSGGTESILMAVKTARDFARAKRGQEGANDGRPMEIVLCENAHPAYDKAARYFGLDVVRTAAKKDTLSANPHAMRARSSSDTILFIASAPSYPHGVMDDVEAIAAIAADRGVCCHVDCCLGGFVLPFARRLGYNVPPFDFSVHGVTSISVDTHKFGLAPKGSSVVLYRSKSLRRYQFECVTEWTGGLYVSPSVAGSRPGSLICGAWASLMHLGEEGYLSSTSILLETTAAFIDAIHSVEGVDVLGDPVMTVVAFTTTEKGLDIFKVNDALSDKGWSMSPLQKPNAVHICLTLQHVGQADAFKRDLEDAVRIIRDDPGAFPEGMAPIYGMSGGMPDRGAIGDLLIGFMDTTTDVR